VDVLGCLVEVLSGKSFEQFLQNRIFSPLDMRDTAFYVPASKKDRLAQLYITNKGANSSRQQFARTDKNAWISFIMERHRTSNHRRSSWVVAG
jgi:CubicO group peptidase (beta-lactamase class C family)